jgi:dipeptidyl aminopeptidase/acylaminoacyl peptidase
MHTTTSRLRAARAVTTTGLLIGLLGAASFATAQGEAGQTAEAAAFTRPAVEVYAALPGARGARLSPDGRRVALIAAVQGRQTFVIWDLGGKDKPRVIGTGIGEPNWIEWKTDRRLIASVRVVSERGPLTRTVDTRLVGIDADGSHVVDLVQADHIPQIQDRVLSFLPDDPGHVLLELPHIDRFTRSTPSGATIQQRIEHPEVVRVDVHTGRTDVVVPQHGTINHWIADEQGRVRMGWTVSRDRKRVELLVRDQPQSAWRSVQTLTLNQGQQFTPLAHVSGQPDRIYVGSNLATGRLAIEEFSLTEARSVRTLVASANTDVMPIVRGDELVGYVQDRRPVYLDQALADTSRAVNAALPDSVSHIVNRSQDGRRVLLRVARGNEPEDYWLLTRTAGQPPVLDPITEAYPGLDPARIAPTRPVSYRARDGLTIPALLTLPAGVRQETGTSPLPFVVLPHGGQTAHDEPGFDPLVQFLASRGWGVLQPQFRGSTGFGQKFLAASYQQWGLAMQDDITDGTRWLISEKLADPQRIVIVGGSYGGYAALMALAREPGLYRAAAAFAPVTDLPTLVDDRWKSIFGDVNLPQIGTDPKQLEQTSPSRLAGRIVQPVLLVHGRKDYTAPVLHTELMETALKKAGHPAQVLYLPEADHYFSRGEDRLALYKALEGFIADHLN